MSNSRNTYEPVELSLKMHGISYTIKGLDWDCNGEELLENFKRLMVAAGFAPSVMGDDLGTWIYQEYSSDVIE